jgi:hypothetical protein
MKKLLSLFGAIGMLATSGSSVVSCFNYGPHVTVTDLELDLTPYPTTRELSEYIRSLYETDDSGFADIAIYSTVDMAKQNMDYITGDATKEQLLECIDDMNAFNKVYNNKTSTNFGYYFADTSSDSSADTILVYGTITNTLVK